MNACELVNCCKSLGGIWPLVTRGSACWEDNYSPSAGQVFVCLLKVVFCEF